MTFYTSGSSGVAKPVIRSSKTLRADAAALVGMFPEIWGGRPAVVSTAPKDHLLGALWRVLAPELAGSLSDPETVIQVEQLIAAHARHGRYLFVTTPSFLEKLLSHPDVGRLRNVFVGIVTSGGLLRSQTSRAATDAFGVCPLEIFGSTEAGTVAFRRQAEGDEWRLAWGVEASVDGEGRLVVRTPYADESPLVMSDAVEMTGSGRFRLLGRTDRRVKVLEQFVSLPEVEAGMESHPFVDRVRAEAFGEAVPRLGALVVLSPAGRTALAGGTYAALGSRLRKDLLPDVGALAFPRRLRFVRTLPTDARGKTTAHDVRCALDAWCREPVVLDWRQTASEIRARLVFPPDNECFDGHFPGCPVLPGVAQLYFLRHFARQAFADFPEAAVYRRLKFQKIVLPGREMDLTVVRQGDGRFAFDLTGAVGRYASGVVEKGGVA